MIGSMSQTVLDQCVLVAAQWGVVASFIPLALSRLIPHATQSRRNYSTPAPPPTGGGRCGRCGTSWAAHSSASRRWPS